MKHRYLAAILFLLAGVLSLSIKPTGLSLIFAVLGVLSTTAILYLPSVWIEDGFAAISYKYQISSLIAGAVFLSIASSSPEFFTSFSGVVLHGVFEIGIVTILWSALFNLCMIVGICSILKSPLKVNKRIISRDMPFYGVAIVMLTLLGIDRVYSSIDFLILIIIYLVYVVFLYFDKSRPYKEKQNDSWKFIIAKISVGLLLVGALSHLLVSMGLRIIDISENLFGYIFPVGLMALLIFAPGTSISDLFMSIAATKKGEDSTAIVNGIGSNTFDLTICIGLPGLIYTLTNGQSVAINYQETMPVIAFVALGYLMVFVFVFSQRKVFKWEGAILCGYFVTATIIQSILMLE